MKPRILPYAIKVAGISRRVHTMDQITADVIFCKREPDNAHDRFAVAVYATQNDQPFQIGYLPQDEARKVPDSHLPCLGQIIWIGVGQKGKVGVRIVI